ncbi:hypothetical protein NL676_012164 [Syzygium grande]|nr:hypothetical protein NL676_012164 [Syzygium grande]
MRGEAERLGVAGAGRRRATGGAIGRGDAGADGGPGDGGRMVTPGGPGQGKVGPKLGLPVVVKTTKTPPLPHHMFWSIPTSALLRLRQYPYPLPLGLTLRPPRVYIYGYDLCFTSSSCIKLAHPWVSLRQLTLRERLWSGHFTAHHRGKHDAIYIHRDVKSYDDRGPMTPSPPLWHLGYILPRCGCSPLPH